MRTSTAELASETGAQTHVRTLFRHIARLGSFTSGASKARENVRPVSNGLPSKTSGGSGCLSRQAQYRYRYYADLGGAVSYASPVEVEDVAITMRHRRCSRTRGGVRIRM